MSINDQFTQQTSVLYVKSVRRDGKYAVSYRFGNGKVINKIESFDSVQKTVDSGRYELAGMVSPFIKGV